jgi:hypothetical protein
VASQLKDREVAAAQCKTHGWKGARSIGSSAWVAYAWAGQGPSHNQPCIAPQSRTARHTPRKRSHSLAALSCTAPNPPPFLRQPITTFAHVPPRPRSSPAASWYRPDGLVVMRPRRCRSACLPGPQEGQVSDACNLEWRAVSWVGSWRALGHGVGGGTDYTLSANLGGRHTNQHGAEPHILCQRFHRTSHECGQLTMLYSKYRKLPTLLTRNAGTQVAECFQTEATQVRHILRPPFPPSCLPACRPAQAPGMASEACGSGSTAGSCTCPTDGAPWTWEGKGVNRALS